MNNRSVYHKEKSITFILLYLTIFVNILIPKAGIKIFGEIPLTLGNVLFFITFIFWIFSKLIYGKIIFDKKIGGVLFIAIVYGLLKYLFIGNFKSHIGFIIPLVIYPLIYYVIIDVVNSEERVEKIFKVITIGVLLISTYALLQFLFGIEKCTIPGITVNYSDYSRYGSAWYLTKSNGVDLSEVKIVSTYQNGNLFGVNMILLYPVIYFRLKMTKQNTLRYFSLLLFFSSVFLSLSRACWLGIFLFIFMCILLQNDYTQRNFIEKITLLFIIPIIIVIIFLNAPSVLNRFCGTNVSDWLSMSGRSDGFITTFNSVLNSDSVLAWLIGPEGIVPWYGLAYEMLPLAMFVQIGFLGVLFYYYCFVRSLCQARLFFKVDLMKGMYFGLLIWLVVGLIEAGYWLPPGALNVFVVVGLIASYKKILQGDHK